MLVDKHDLTLALYHAIINRQGQTMEEKELLTRLREIQAVALLQKDRVAHDMIQELIEDRWGKND